MADKPDRPEFIITLRAPAHPGGGGTIVALRRILKALLRAHGWRCVAIRPAEGKPGSTPY